MDVTTEYRSHWVDKDGKRHASRYGVGGRRYDLQPVLNLDELREFTALGRRYLPTCSSTPDGSSVAVWYAQQVLDYPKTQNHHLITEVCAELTDIVPLYHKEWRQPFVDMRERYKAVP